jgi:hypothetical protein
VNAGVLVGAVLALLAFAGGGVLLTRGVTGGEAAQSAGLGPTSAPAAVPAAPVTPSPQPQMQRVDHAQPIAWSNAGQLVIDYYNGLDKLPTAWQMLSPTAQAIFGTEPQFRSYWSEYSSVSARDAFGVTDNADGSVQVPVQVTYNKDGTEEVVKRVLRVDRVNGRLLIDSDPR